MALAAELGKDQPIPADAQSEVPVGMPSRAAAASARRPPGRAAAGRADGQHRRGRRRAVPHGSRLTGSARTGEQRFRFDRPQHQHGLVLGADRFVANPGATPSCNRGSGSQTPSQAQALYAYQQIVLQSFTDVEDALVAYAQDQVRIKDMQDEVTANERAVRAVDAAVRARPGRLPERANGPAGSVRGAERFGDRPVQRGDGLGAAVQGPGRRVGRAGRRAISQARRPRHPGVGHHRCSLTEIRRIPKQKARLLEQPGLLFFQNRAVYFAVTTSIRLKNVLPKSSSLSVLLVSIMT